VTVHDAAVLLAGLVVGLLPGLALMLALGIRRPLQLVALAPTTSIGLLTVVAGGCALVGLPFGAAAAAVVVGALLVAGGLQAVTAGRRPRVRVRAPATSVLAGGGLVLLGTGLGVTIWMDGLGRLATVAQEHDMILHHVIVSYLAGTGQAAAWQVLPADLMSGEPVFFYPAGAHLAPALLTGLGTGTVVALNAMSVVYLAVCWSLSTATLSYLAARRLGLGRAGGWLAAGTASVVGAALWRPVFHLMHAGGIYPTAVALALAPGLIAGLLMVPARGWRVPVALGTGAAGIVAAYPGAAVTVGLSVLAWFLGDLVTGEGARRLRRAVLPLGLAALVAALVSAPLLAQAYRVVAGTSAFPPDTSPARFGDALGSALGAVYGGFIDPDRSTGQGVVTALCLLGVLAVAWQRRGLGLVAAWATWVVITFGAFRSPGTGLEAPVTGFFYNALLRVWSHVSLFVPSLAALAVVITTAGVVAAIRRALPAFARGWRLAALGTAAVTVAFAFGPAERSTEVAAAALASRYAQPDFIRVSADDRAAIRWLARHVRPGQRVLNSANDGSTFLYVQAGIPVVNVASLGLGTAPYTYRLLESFNRYPVDEQIRELLVSLDIAWVYVDAMAPAIGSGSAPQRWVNPSVPYTLAPGLSGLDELALPGLDLRFRSGSVSVYHLDLERVRALS